MRLHFEIAAALVLTGMTIPVAESHEYWIDAKSILDGGTTVLDLDLKVGQRLDGVSLPYIPETVAEFHWIHGGVGPITGRIGDVPAARVPFDPSVGAVIFQRTKPRRLVHKDWAKFTDYLEMEGLDGIAEQHDARGLPRFGFAETYTRHAKLVSMPDGILPVEDRYQGSPIEIVLTQVKSTTDGILLEGQVISDAAPLRRQITAFQGDVGDPDIQWVHTRVDGTFEIALPGTGPVLLNTVAIRPSLSEDAAWHSDWASMFLIFD